MQTVVIHNMGEEGVSLYLQEGDLSRFDGVEVNYTETGFEDELADMNFNKKISSEEAKQAILAGATLIQCAFLF